MKVYKIYLIKFIPHENLLFTNTCNGRNVCHHILCDYRVSHFLLPFDPHVFLEFVSSPAPIFLFIYDNEYG